MGYLIFMQIPVSIFSFFSCTISHITFSNFIYEKKNHKFTDTIHTCCISTLGLASILLFKQICYLLKFLAEYLLCNPFNWLALIIQYTKNSIFNRKLSIFVIVSLPFPSASNYPSVECDFSLSYIRKFNTQSNDDKRNDRKLFYEIPILFFKQNKNPFATMFHITSKNSEKKYTQKIFTIT